jgi:Ni,Fe-hydrogenase III small subunit/Pyruvate/2-oxoacid:ferredoxin oxidoreductase delta subunit
MLKTLYARLKQGYRTIGPLEKASPVMPKRFRGCPVIDTSKCAPSCRKCAEACPTEAITIGKDDFQLDLGRCLFCTDCVDACAGKNIHYSQEYRLAVSRRSDLLFNPQNMPLPKVFHNNKAYSLFKKSLKLRQVSAGGCNGCELDVNVLNTVVFDIGRFGIQFVASPRHADGLLITGPVTNNMKKALEKTYAATPSPKIVIAVGACAISGGPYTNNHCKTHNGVDGILPVELYIPGCPPHPLTIMDGLQRWMASG